MQQLVEIVGYTERRREVINTSNFETNYAEEIVIYNEILERVKLLQENDVDGAYSLTQDSLQALNRWSEIKYTLKKELGRGEDAALKERSKERCDVLDKVHIFARMTWSNAADFKKTHREDMQQVICR